MDTDHSTSHLCRRLSASVTMRLLPVVAVVAAAAMAFVSSGCGETRHSYVANASDGETTPTMTTVNVETYISDSGYTRYHLSTPLWQMFEDASEPFWRFPDGLDLEQYDLAMRPQATMVSDSATYFSRKRLWRLDGNVVMVNTMRDSFLTHQLFWDQTRRRVYSDSFIHIVRSDRIIEGYGFESNENMTSYTIKNPTGIIPVERRDNKADESDSAAISRRRSPEEIAARQASLDSAKKAKPKQPSDPDGAMSIKSIQPAK